MARLDATRKATLEAASPYELRVDLSKEVPEKDVRTALATGDVGFVHSFTTGSAVDLLSGSRATIEVDGGVEGEALKPITTSPCMSLSGDTCSNYIH
jgi:hypothetical protein